MDSSQNIIELCAGYGGISMGIKRVIPEIRVRAYAEIEAYAVANLVEKIEAGKMDAAPIWTDLKTFPGESFYGKIHGIIGGYPCQPFSTAGQRRGEQDPRHLFPHILKLVKTIRPIWCFFENVEGHLSLGYGEVYRSLRDLGYSVEAGIFSASECGSPHRRKRLFILAHSEGYRALRETRSGFQKTRGQRRTLSREPIGTSGGQKELANSRGSELYRLSEQQRKKNLSIRNSSKTMWPARPGQEQFEWEEARTIEPRLGGAINGTPNRVDRIRMLGNGVVPDTAELAFRTLINKTKKDIL